jgi:hypothetical protein
MGSNKITGLANGTLIGDAANLGQVQSTVAKLISITGTDTVVGTMSPTLTAYAAGQLFYFIASGANTGAVTLNIDGLGAKNITRDGSTALAAGDINSGEIVVVIYDGTRFQMINAANSFGNTTINGTLTVTGNTGLQANVSVTSALSVGGTFAVTGAATLGSTLAVTGKSDLPTVSTASANAAVAVITDLSATGASITSANVGTAVVTIGTVTNLTATSASVASVNAGVALLTTATVTNLTATGASIASANLGNAVISALTLTGVSVASANVGVANITDLRAVGASVTSANLGTAVVTNGTVTNLTATSASVASVNAAVALLTTATVTTLTASGASIASANIGNLQFTAASIASINAGVAVINNLTATSASIASANVGTAVITTGTVTNLTSTAASVASANVGVALITTGTVTSLTATGASVASANVGTAVVTGLTVTGASIASMNGVTANITTVNATTVDATNVEVTNVKAKDGTAAITIADSTGNVGIGASPTRILTVYKASDPEIEVKNSSASSYFGTQTTPYGAISANDAKLYSQNGIALMADGGSAVIKFASGGSGEKMRIDASGNVGIGTASPGFLFDTYNSSTGTDYIAGRFYSQAAVSGESRTWLKVEKGSAYGGAVGGYISQGVGSGLLFGTQNGSSTPTERMRIDSSGNVGIGGTAEAFARMAVTGTLPTSSNISIAYRALGTIPSGTTSSFSSFNSYAYTQAASFTLTSFTAFAAAGAQLGAGSTVTNNYCFSAEAANTFATNNYGFYSDIASGSNRWNFYAAGTAQNYFAGNTAIGTTSPSGRLTVSSGASDGSNATNPGTIQIRQINSSVTEGGGLEFVGSTFGSGYGYKISAIDSSGVQLVFGARHNSATWSEVMRITSGGEVYIAGTTDQGAYNLQVNGTGVWGAGAYVNGSDARLKDDITTLNDGLNVVSQLRPVTFKYKPDYSKDQNVQTGFIAQELQAALAGKDYVDGIVQAGPNHLNVAYQSLIPILVKAIQELTARVAELEAK